MRVTYVIAIIILISFAASFVLGTEYIFGRFGFSGKNLLAHPEVLVTSVFLHGSIVHLLSNILVLLFFGLAVEDELGKARMLAVFFLGAFAGDLFSLLFYPFDSLSIGASAGIFALIGIGMLVRPLDLSVYPLIVPVPLAFLGVFYALYNAYGFVFDASSNISYIAHFGGMAVGLAYGFMKKGVKKGLKIILVTIGIMILIPILFVLLKVAL
ncbi:MAG: rhomboid family intramembrane serine protease [Candidatus Aenigmarchaeota archaeon]|nr:rhomboid family intramembrane serine protease [Candidatus Aenigmarchaeota archaeon]MDI6722863.1 rhomboid family intramembrane serine protease [Candidatus Aenigmarchaeota archaeon]